MSIPHLFRCPISLDLFTDPVTLSTGQTYDRPSIERWLGDGNLTCPVTMQRLSDTSLVPNHTLRHLIDQWLLAGPDPNARHKPTLPAQCAGTGAAFALASIKHNLQTPGTAVAVKLEILKKVRILSVESDIGQACLIQLGYFPLLVQLLFQIPSDPELIEVALDCVLSLSPSAQLDSLNIVRNGTNLDSFVHLLEQGNIKIKTSLCCLLDTIATSNVTQELCLILGRLRRVLQVVVTLLHSRADASKASDAAVRAVAGICLLEGTRANAVREGAVEGLIAYLMNSNQRNGSRALATLEVLLGLEAGKKALIKTPNAVKVLVKSVFRVSSSDNEGSEHAVGALLIACCESARARAQAVNAGVLTQLLLLLQSQCGSKAKAKARALLKLLRSMWAKDPVMGGKFYHVM